MIATKTAMQDGRVEVNQATYKDFEAKTAALARDIKHGLNNL